jgi:hypothetical protein
MDASGTGRGEVRPSVQMDFSIPLDPHELLHNARVNNTGDGLGQAFRAETAWYEHWVATDRLTGEAWELESDRAFSQVRAEIRRRRPR